MSKPRIVYIHGDQVLCWAWGWVATLAEDLRTAGYPTFFELFPDSIEARARYWLPFLRDHVRAGPRDVLLGWSCGAVAAMRYAQDNPVRGLVLVAPYYTDLGLDEVRRSGFVLEPWDWAQIRRNVGSVTVFHSDADPYISQDEFSEVTHRLQAERILIHGAGHFADRDPFSELTDCILRRYP